MNRKKNKLNWKGKAQQVWAKTQTVSLETYHKSTAWAKANPKETGLIILGILVVIWLIYYLVWGKKSRQLQANQEAEAQKQAEIQALQAAALSRQRQETAESIEKRTLEILRQNAQTP